MLIFDLARFKKNFGLTQKQIAEAVGYKESFLSTIGKGKKSAPRALLDALAKAFGVENIDAYTREIPDRRGQRLGGIRGSGNKFNQIDAPNAEMLVENVYDSLTPEQMEQAIMNGGQEQAEALKKNQPQPTIEQLLESLAKQGADDGIKSIGFAQQLIASAIKMKEEAEKRVRELEIENASLKAKLEVYETLYKK